MKSEPPWDPAPDRWHGDLLALDPSIRSPGLSLFRHGALIACTRVEVCKDAKLGRGERVQRVAMDIIELWASMPGATRVTTLVYEWPQWYAPGKGKGNPGDLAGLVGVGAAVAANLTTMAIVQGHRPPQILTPEPDEWCGNIPKATKGSAWSSPRGARVRDALTPGELPLVPDQHDAIDSVGLGLYGLGRAFGKARVRVFAGAAR